jgi:hypothetical protein
VVSAIDARQMAHMKGKSNAEETWAEAAEEVKKPEKRWLSHRNEALWTRAF